MSKLVKSKKEVGELSEPNQQEVFLELTAEKTINAWPSGGTVLEKWSVMKSALIETVIASLGIEKQRHSDWFRESTDAIKPRIQHRNKMYTKWLSTKRTEDHLNFNRAYGDARRSIRKAKNDHMLQDFRITSCSHMGSWGQISG